MPKITGHHEETVEITGNDGIWTVTRGAILAPPGGASGLEESGSGNTMRVFGKINSDMQAIDSNGLNTVMEFRESARITGTVSTQGAGAEITNHGRVRSIGDYDVFSSYADGFRLKNHGIIDGEQLAITIHGVDSIIRNEKGGTISAVYAITTPGGDPEGTVSIINRGLIQGSYALDGGNSIDYIRNYGRIEGVVLLDGGNDTLDTRGGRVIGQIIGNEGNDTLITSNANHKLTEASGDGIDRVRSTVSYTLTDHVEQLHLIGRKDINGTGTAGEDKLFGNSGDNRLKGLAGDDILDGEGGNDTLTGGADAERFYFNKNYDKDTITDFQQGIDRVYIYNWAALSDFQDVMSRASNHGQDVWITVGDDVLVLKGLHKADLTADDFFLF